MSTKTMKLKALLPWFGGKRTLAPRIVTELGPHSYYFEAGAGSMAVLFAKEPAHHETVCDLHGGMTNLAWIVQHEKTAARLFDRLQRTAYNDAIFAKSKAWLEKYCSGPLDICKYSSRIVPGPHANPGIEDWAYHYFICSWMGRNGVAGTEVTNYQIATRFTAGGGSGPLRFMNAIDSIPAWWQRLRNVHVLRRDLFKMLARIEDAAGVSIYADPPYIVGGHQYLHGFSADDHARLAKELSRFKRARVVVSYYAHPQLEDLYSKWTIIDCARPKHLATQNARGQKVRVTAPEVLIVNGRSLA